MPPLYDGDCPAHGVRETFATMAAARADMLPCGEPGCKQYVRRVFTPIAARIDSAGEIRSNDSDPRARGWNLGLDEPTSVASSNRANREIARKKNLSPLDGGSYRLTPR